MPRLDVDRLGDRDDDGLVTAVEIATMAGISPVSVRVYAASGRMGMPKPVGRRGRANVWDLGEVVLWMSREGKRERGRPKRTDAA